MKRLPLIVVGLLLLPATLAGQHDTVIFQGQASGWMQYGHRDEMPLGLGARYIPALKVQMHGKTRGMLEIETSANVMLTMMAHPSDTMTAEGIVKPYRLCVRYAADQYEIRLGLQKISFGSASMLRPLMWFDRLDPRDPLQLTDGVYALLGRYYFLNNTNIWLWGLYGNEKSGIWDLGNTRKRIPEAGGRFQFPLWKGELAFTGHFRQVDTTALQLQHAGYSHFPEGKLGIDGKWDVGPGIWFECTRVHKFREAGVLNNQTMANLGMDFTFAILNGITVGAEYLLVSVHQDAWRLRDPYHLTAVSASTPLSLSDHISAIVFAEWESRAGYAYLSYRHQFRKISLYGMAFFSSSGEGLPMLAGTNAAFMGNGFQILVVYHH
ncbi:MAG TPA: hypothetical protein P5228_03180 [Bacteroidales bacterium]|nr:hypothetical protein [Bacteroidales bacterium]HRZ48799.1 hypothetical protein [Bacteroidales bacterium]